MVRGMTDLAALAAALGIPREQMERVAKPLEALEAAFRPAAATLEFDEEPATTFDAAEDGE